MIRHGENDLARFVRAGVERLDVDSQLFSCGLGEAKR